MYIYKEDVTVLNHLNVPVHEEDVTVLDHLNVYDQCDGLRPSKCSLYEEDVTIVDHIYV